MIRGIVAIDNQRGMSNDDGIPWNLPSDQQYFVEKLKTGRILMGQGTYTEVKNPFGNQDNYVASRLSEELRPGFIKIDNAREFLENATEDIWNLGGSSLFTTTIDLIDELYITQIQKDFNCSKFFPEFHDRFDLASESPLYNENDTLFTFQIWKRK